MKYIRKDIELNENERVIYKNGEAVFILDYKTLKTRPITKERVTLQAARDKPSETLIDDKVVKEDDHDYSKDLLDLANKHVQCGDYKNVGEALNAILPKYPKLYDMHSKNVMRS
jgi:hypothetical protein